MPVISRTAFRISCLGGGTDIPQWYEEYGGAVLSFSINHYCYVLVKEVLPYFNHDIRAVYATTELCNSIEELSHPLIREVLRYMNIEHNIELQYSGDLPSRSGIGSSSAFAVGLLHALFHLKEESTSKEELADIAYYVERVQLGEAGGKVDSYACAYGGLNKFIFPQEGKPIVERINLGSKRKHEFESKLMLFHLGGSRISSDISKVCINNYKNKYSNLCRIQEMVDEGISILKNKYKNLDDFGLLLDEYWHLKKDLAECVSSEYINYVYDTAKKNGAIGGKLNGSGGGGTMLLYVPEEYQEHMVEVLKPAIVIPFKIDFTGSMIIYNG